MEKKFYTFAEILLAFRYEYQELKKLLEQLKSYISIEDEKVLDFYFDACYKEMIYFTRTDDKKLSLVVVEKLNELKKIRERLMYLSGYAKKHSRLFYDLTSCGSHHGFELVKKERLVSINPEINITNKKEFNELVRHILNTDMMKLETERKKTLMLDGWRIYFMKYLLNLGNFHKNILYNPDNDTITIKGISDTLDATYIFNGPIPEYHIDDSLKNIINKKHKVGTIVIQDTNIDIKGTSFGIIDINSGLELVKIKR